MARNSKAVKNIKYEEISIQLGRRQLKFQFYCKHMNKRKKKNTFIKLENLDKLLHLCKDNLVFLQLSSCGV